MSCSRDKPFVSINPGEFNLFALIAWFRAASLKYKLAFLLPALSAALADISATFENIANI